MAILAMVMALSANGLALVPAAAADSLITLTGNVSTETGPLGGATGSFDGVSDITDANGNYTLHPFADSTGTIGVAGLIRASAPLTVGSSVPTDNMSIPTEGVTSSVQVVDGSGTPSRVWQSPVRRVWSHHPFRE